MAPVGTTKQAPPVPGILAPRLQPRAGLAPPLCSARCTVVRYTLQPAFDAAEVQSLGRLETFLVAEGLVNTRRILTFVTESSERLKYHRN